MTRKSGLAKLGRGFRSQAARHEEEAARAYDAAALEGWGEFAHINFPHEKEEEM